MLAWRGGVLATKTTKNISVPTDPADPEVGLIKITGKVIIHGIVIRIASATFGGDLGGEIELWSNAAEQWTGDWQTWYAYGGNGMYATMARDSSAYAPKWTAPSDNSNAETPRGYTWLWVGPGFSGEERLYYDPTYIEFDTVSSLTIDTIVFWSTIPGETGLVEAL